MHMASSHGMFVASSPRHRPFVARVWRLFVSVWRAAVSPSFISAFVYLFVPSIALFVYFYFLDRPPRRPAHSPLSQSSEFRSPSHGGNLNRSASLSCTERAPEGGSVGGSNTQIPGTPFQYIPDFCVRALTDLQFVKVTPPTRHFIRYTTEIILAFGFTTVPNELASECTIRRAEM